MLASELSLNIILIVASIIIIISYAILIIKLKPSIKLKRPKSPEKAQTKVESKKKVQTKTHAETAETEEIQMTKKDVEAKKSFLLFGERNFEGCPHKFGYLASLPKNTPIPDECFGCPQIVECLGTLRTK